MTTCPNCGGQARDDARFCPTCGHALGPVRQPPMTSLSPSTPDLQTRLEQLESRISRVEDRLPNSHIISKSFLARVFTVWGYGLVIYLLFMLFILLLVVLL